MARPSTVQTEMKFSSYLHTTGPARAACATALDVLSAHGAAVLIMARADRWWIATSMDPVRDRFEQLQLTVGEGPGPRAYAEKRPVLSVIFGLVTRAGLDWPRCAQPALGRYSASPYRSTVGSRSECSIWLGAGHSLWISTSCTKPATSPR